MKFIFSLAMMFILFTGCPKVGDGDPGYQLGETIMLSLNTPIKIKSENITLLFSEVSSDNRCPKGVNCVMEGKANVKIDVAVSDAVSPIEIEARGLCYKEDGSCGTSAMAQGYIIKLYQVYPYPEEGASKNTTKYLAKVMVTKK